VRTKCLENIQVRKDEMREKCRKSHTEELYQLDSSYNNVKAIESRRMRLVG
jgi:hypothetical protein